MTKNYEEIRLAHGASKKKYGEVIPGIMTSLGNITNAIVDADILDEKTMEMVFIGCAISRHCEPCIASHVRKFHGAGGSREELVAVIGVAIAMGGGPDANYATAAIEAYDQLAAADA